MNASTLKQPTMVRIWRGRTPCDRANEYEAYNYEAGIKPLLNQALGVQTCREDRQPDTAFMTLASGESVEAMSQFTGGDPPTGHPLEPDEACLSALPTAVPILRLLTSHGVPGATS